MKIVTYAILTPVLSAAVIFPAFAQWPIGREGLQETKVTEGSPHVTGTGRFQVFVSPQAKGYTFMLDTDTGRVWILKKDHTSGEFSWQRVTVEQVDVKESAKSETQEKKSTEKDTAGKK